MARIRFLTQQVYETKGPGRGPTFAAGSELDAAGVGAALGREVAPEWAEAFLHRWVQRGVAVEIGAAGAEEAHEEAGAEEAPEEADGVDDGDGALTLGDDEASQDERVSGDAIAPASSEGSDGAGAAGETAEAAGAGRKAKGKARASADSPTEGAQD